MGPRRMASAAMEISAAGSGVGGPLQKRRRGRAAEERLHNARLVAEISEIADRSQRSIFKSACFCRSSPSFSMTAVSLASLATATTKRSASKASHRPRMPRRPSQGRRRRTPSVVVSPGRAMGHGRA